VGYPSYFEDIRDRLVNEFSNYRAVEDRTAHPINRDHVSRIVNRIFDQTLGPYLNVLTEPDLDMAS
jgi:hypothetical protein